MIFSLINIFYLLKNVHKTSSMAVQEFNKKDDNAVTFATVELGHVSKQNK